MGKIYITLVFLLSFVGFATAQTWIPDTLFGTNSLLYVNPGAGDELSNFVLQPDGKIIAGGYDYDISFNGYNNIMIRFDACGTIDSSFGSGGIVKHRFDQRNRGFSYALHTGNKILCAGLQSNSNAGSDQIPFIARYNPDGSVDDSFGYNGTHALRFDSVTSGALYSVIPLADGRILCGGTVNASSYGGANGMGAMRFLENGMLDITFNTKGKVIYKKNTVFNPVRAALMQNGDVILTGRYADSNGNFHFVAVSYNQSGDLNYGYGTDGEFTDPVDLSEDYIGAYMGVQQDEKIVLASMRKDADDGIEVIRIMPGGYLDPSFGDNGHVNLVYDRIRCTGVKILEDSRILILCQYRVNYYSGAVICLLPDGSVDGGFGDNGLLFVNMNPGGTHQINDALELPNERILFGTGTFDNYFMGYTTHSNVPHISGDAFMLSTTGSGTFQWYLNGEAIPGETSSSCIPQANGDYTVEITSDSGCTFLSDPYTVNSVGINEPSLSELQIYPNPFSSEFQIKTEKEMKSVALFDPAGRAIISKANLNTSNLKLQTAGLAPGIYFLKVVVDGKPVVSKILRQ